MSKPLLILSLVIFLISSEAQACFRCGLFGRRCRYTVPVHKVIHPVVKQVATPVVTQTLIFNNTAPLPQVGNTVYGFSAASQPYRTSSALLIQQLSRANDNVSTLSQLASSQMSNETEVNRLLASSQALVQTINAAKVQTSAQLAAPTTTIVKQTVYPDGTVRTEAIDPTKPQPAMDNKTPSIGASIIGEKCAKCHGLEQTSPKGDLYFDKDHPLEATDIIKALKQIRDKKMPKDNPLDASEAAQAMEELLKLEKTE